LVTTALDIRRCVSAGLGEGRRRPHQRRPGHDGYREAWLGGSV